jgi:uncharacterized protein DUF4383
LRGHAPAEQVEASPYLGVALFGALVDHGTDANLLPINDADTVLHLGLGLRMIALGLIGTRLWKQRVTPTG